MRTTVLLMLLALLLTACGSSDTSSDTASVPEPAETNTVSEVEICQALADLVFSDENPAFEPTPTDLEGEELLEWLNDLMKREQEYEENARREVAARFGVSEDQVQSAYANHIRLDGSNTCGD